MDNIIISFFVVLIILFIYAVIELICLHRFKEFFFKSGFTVYRTSFQVPGFHSNTLKGSTLTSREGKYRFTSDDRVLFLSVFVFYSTVYKSNSPFSLISIATIRPDESVEVISKIPRGMTILFVFFFSFWAYLAFSYNEPNLAMMGGLVFLVIAVFSFFTERSRIRLMIEELKTIITIEKNNQAINRGF